MMPEKNITEVTGENNFKRVFAIPKRLETSVLTFLKWIFAITLPVWIYGLILACGRTEIKPVTAMLILNFVSAVCFRMAILKPLAVKWRTRKNTLTENKI